VPKDELKVFLGIPVVSGYNAHSLTHSYWEAASDVRKETVQNAMRRDWFTQIMRFLHFANNTKPDLSDKMCNLRNSWKPAFLEIFDPLRIYLFGLVTSFGACRTEVPWLFSNRNNPRQSHTQRL